MKYVRDHNLIIVRLEKGEEIISSLLNLSETEHIAYASVSGIGATNNFTMGIFDLETQIYHKKTYQGAYEIVSLLGNLTRKEGRAYVHLHMSASSLAGIVGGHLNEAYISATCEMSLICSDTKVERVKDETIGINLMEF